MKDSKGRDGRQEKQEWKTGRLGEEKSSRNGRKKR
jgi:hypothetical protein